MWTSLLCKVPTLSLGIPALQIPLCPISQDAVAPFSIDELRPALSDEAQVLFPLSGDPRAAEYGYRWNKFHAPTAEVIIVPSTEADVVEIVKHAAKKSVENFFVQNGGHGWDIGLGGRIKNGLYMNMQSFQEISIDTERGLVTAGAGVSTDDIIKAAHRVKKILPTTSCYCPSHIGPTLGGGVGRFQGLYGMLLDNIVSARVVLSTGEAVTASTNSHPDLFWALKGAGANFGVVVSATYKLHPQPPDGTIYNLDMVYPRSKIRDVFKVANNQVLDPKSSVALVYAGIPKTNGEVDVTFLVNFVHIGMRDAGFAAATPYLALDPTILDNSSYPYDKFAQNVAQKAVVEMCKPARHNMFTAGVLKYDLDVQVQLFDEMTEVFDKNPDVRTSYVLFETYSLQGVQKIPAESTAFAHRDVRHHVLVVGGNTLPETDDVVSAWGASVRELTSAKGGFAEGERHVHLNFARGDETLQEKYGEKWRIEKLWKLKKKYDPVNLFGSFHPILP